MSEININSIDLKNIPKHIAVIMDGNGRWAIAKGKDRIYGHYQGINSVKQIVEFCGEIGISYLTLYTFSTENWNRPQHEVNSILELLVETIDKQIKELHTNNVKLNTIGNLNSLPQKAKESLEKSIHLTQNNTGLNLILALSYSSYWEIGETIKKISHSVVNNLMTIDQITPEIIQLNLETAPFPNPDLLIRTGGEYRLSNFLLFQLAYTELYFTSTLWPDFGKKDLTLAICDYQQRQRRFGLTSDQILHSHKS